MLADESERLLAVSQWIEKAENDYLAATHLLELRRTPVLGHGTHYVALSTHARD